MDYRTNVLACQLYYTKITKNITTLFCSSSTNSVIIVVVRNTELYFVIFITVILYSSSINRTLLSTLASISGSIVLVRVVKLQLFFAKIKSVTLTIISFTDFMEPVI